MKSLPLVIAVFLCVVGSTIAQEAKPIPVQVTKANLIDPEDLGIRKYVFETPVPAGKVMVLRRTLADTRKIVTEVIHYTDGGPAYESIVLMDSADFPFADEVKPRVIVREGKHKVESYHGKRASSYGFIGPKLTLHLVNDKDGSEVTLTYECVIEDYEAAKKRIPGLVKTTPEGTWSFHAIIGVE